MNEQGVQQFDASNNVSLYDKILGTFFSLKNKMSWFSIYKKAYRNYVKVTCHVLQGKFPIDVVLRNGKQINLKTIDEVAMYGLLQSMKDFDYDPSNDLLTIKIIQSNIQKNLKLFGISRGIDAFLTFRDNSTYDTFPVEGKIVIDIGANIGDTPIYFALRGAKKIIGLEPFPKNYEMAKKNIESNDLSTQIKIMLAGCSSKQGFMKIDPEYESSMRSNLQEFDKGIQVPLITLENILSENDIVEAVLKMDCERCEYEVILLAPDDILRRFSHIQIEYHDGYKNLKERLEKAGFRVTSKIVDTVYRGHIEAIRV